MKDLTMVYVDPQTRNHYQLTNDEYIALFVIWEFEDEAEFKRKDLAFFVRASVAKVNKMVVDLIENNLLSTSQNRLVVNEKLATIFRKIKKESLFG
jgi:DNA-binding MarR family transcriptional regulator